jgi:hypothetical protein
MHRRAKGVAYAELEEPRDELRGAAVEDGQAKDGLEGADSAVERVAAGQAVS